MSLDIVWRILFAAYFCAAFVTPQLVASRRRWRCHRAARRTPPHQLLAVHAPHPRRRPHATQHPAPQPHFSVCIVPRGGGPSAGARPPPYSPPSPSPLSIEPTCSRPACQDSHALHTTHRCHPCCSHLRFDDPVSPPASATITRFAAFTYATRSPASHGKVHGQPLPTLHCTVDRELGSLLPSSAHLLLRHPLQIRHKKTRLGAGQPARSLPAAFGGQLLQGSVCSWFGQQPPPAFQLLRHHAADPHGP